MTGAYDDAGDLRFSALGAHLEGRIKSFTVHGEFIQTWQDLAEEEERVRVLRRRAREARDEGRPMDETMEAAYLELVAGRSQRSGPEAGLLANLLSQLIVLHLLAGQNEVKVFAERDILPAIEGLVGRDR